MSSSQVTNAMRRALPEINLQLFARLFTFSVNLIIIRYLTANVLGVINVRLMLLYTTAQFLSREPVRRVCLSEAKSQAWYSLVNLMWLNVIFSTVISLSLSTIWSYYVDKPDPNQVPDYDLALNLIPIAVIIEMISEPVYIYLQLRDIHAIRVTIDIMVLIVRCFGMAIFIIYYPNQAVKIFTLCLLFSSIVQSVFYTCYFTLFLNQPLSMILPAKVYINPILIKLTISFVGHTFIKQLLTEGERFIMAFFNPLTFAEQGIFDIVNNLGALPARLIFKPIEDTAYRSFSETISRQKSSQKERIKSLALRQKLLRIAFILGLTIFIFGYNYSQLALIIYNRRILGQSLALSLMRWLCFYDLVIAINGITEAFSLAAMPRHKIDQSIPWLVMISFIYILSGIVLVTLIGASGLILANILNMLFRIVYSLRFLKTWHSHYRIKDDLLTLLPSKKVFTTYLLIYIITGISEYNLCCVTISHSLVHLIIGAISFIILSGIIIKADTEIEQYAAKFLHKVPILKHFFVIKKSKNN